MTFVSTPYGAGRVATISLRLTPEQNERLGHAAARLSQSKSNVLRMALDRLLGESTVPPGFWNTPGEPTPAIPAGVWASTGEPVAIQPPGPDEIRASAVEPLRPGDMVYFNQLGQITRDDDAYRMPARIGIPPHLVPPGVQQAARRIDPLTVRSIVQSQMSRHLRRLRALTPRVGGAVVNGELTQMNADIAVMLAPSLTMSEVMEAALWSWARMVTRWNAIVALLPTGGPTSRDLECDLVTSLWGAGPRPRGIANTLPRDAANQPPAASEGDWAAADGPWSASESPPTQPAPTDQTGLPRD